MTICKRCGKENQDHFKFCLGCGGELSAATAAAGPPAGAAMAKTVVADPGSLPRKQGTSPTPPGGVPAGVGSAGGSPMGGHPPFMGGPPTPFTPAPPATPGWSSPAAGPLPGVGPGAGPRPGTPGPAASPFGAGAGGPAPMGPAPMAPPPAFGAPGSPAGGAMGAPGFGGGAAKPKSAAMPASAPSPYSPAPAPGFGSPSFAPPGAPPSAPAPMGPPAMGPPLGAPPATAAPAAGPTTRPCPNCGFEVPTNFMFCGACGQKLTPVAARAGTAGATLQPTTIPDTRAGGRITLIRPDGSEGGSLDLEEGENKIGRQSGPLFENDGYLSPLHAEIVINAAGAVVRDANSLNGVFVKITSEEEIGPGDTFRIGQELIRFDIINPPAPLEDGTEIMGSPNPGYWGRLSVIIGKEIEGSAFPLLGDAVTMGRERGDINFPDDGYVSGLHARLTQRNGKFYLNDLGSSNGTFLKIRGERALENGSFVLLGQQLFRLNLS